MQFLQDARLLRIAHATGCHDVPRHDIQAALLYLATSSVEIIMEEFAYFDSTESETGPAQKGQIRAAALKALNEALEGQSGLTSLGRNFIAEAVKSPPNGNARASSGRYASVSMGVTLTAPHRFLGMAVMDTLEHDDTVMFFCEPTLPLKRENTASKRKRSYGQRPEVMVVRKNEVVTVDIVPLATLEKQEGTGIYERAGCIWVCPSAEASAAAMGMRHEVWTENSIHTTRLANNSVLADYYSHPATEQRQLERCQSVADLALERGVISITEVLQELRLKCTIDDVFHAIARGSVYIDLGRCDLQLQHTARLFASKALADAHHASQAAIAAASTWRPATIDLPKENQFVVWDGVECQIKHVGLESIALLRGGDYVTHDIVKFKELLTSGVVRPVDGAAALAEARLEDATELLLRASPENLERALKALDAISPYLSGTKKNPGRTHRRHIKFYRDAETATGNGFVGLIPGYGKSGTRQRRMAEDVLSVVIKVREKELAKATNSKLNHIHKLIVLACEEKGLPPPSYSWFAKFAKESHRKNRYVETLKSKGRKAAYAVTRRSNNPAHPEPIRIFERVHIDHTQIDLECIFSSGTEALGRPWLTLAIDHFSRRCVAMALSYESPSARSLMLVLRDCVRRHGRLPSLIVVDGGKEFRSKWFQVICAFFRINVVYRPAGHARWGAQMERMFGTTNTAFFYNLQGNTQLTKDVRSMSREVSPEMRAIWTLPALYPVLQQFLFEEYDRTVNTGIATTPRAAFERNEQVMGKRDVRQIPYDERFLIMTCPLVDKGTARVTLNGVKVNYFYFNADVLYPLVGKDIAVRFEPFDLSTVWGFVDGYWVRLKSKFDRLLKGYTQYELEQVCDELRKRRSNAEKDRLADTRIARFISSVHQQEAALLARKRALEAQAALNADGEASASAGSEEPQQAESASAGQEANGAPKQRRNDDEGDPSEMTNNDPSPVDSGGDAVEIVELETY